MTSVASGQTARLPQPRRAAFGPLVGHLLRREIALSHRSSLIGAGWPLVRQLVQLAVLVFVFSHVLDLGVPDYPAFVYCGLLGWSWFTTALTQSTTAIPDNRNLAMRPGFPTIVLPLLAVLVPLVDLAIALPVLVVLLLVDASLQWTIVLLPLLLLVQGVLSLGLAWLCSSLTVFVRDIPHLVGVALVLGFYVTPVYFDVARVPEQYTWILRLNPMAVLLEAERAVLLGTPFPPVANFIAVVGFSVLLALGGWAAFRRLAPLFADEL
jgi:lipopolysaccharide transport system permease protein